jgi:hypothetical protein
VIDDKDSPHIQPACKLLLPSSPSSPTKDNTIPADDHVNEVTYTLIQRDVDDNRTNTLLGSSGNHQLPIAHVRCGSGLYDHLVNDTGKDSSPNHCPLNAVVIVNTNSTSCTSVTSTTTTGGPPTSSSCHESELL